MLNSVFPRKKDGVHISTYDQIFGVTTSNTFLWCSFVITIINENNKLNPDALPNL